MRLLPLFLLIACEPMPATGNPLAPVPAARSSRIAAPGPAAPVAADEFDFDEDAKEIDGPESEILDPAALLAMSQGKPPPPTPVAPQPAPVVPAPVVPVPVMVPVPQPAPVAVWDPASAVPPNWGVRLVSTLVDTQPPRAVLGLADGKEVVVKPGSFLPDQRLVVMAVGRNAVQVSRVVPDGYQARVETRMLSSLFPSQNMGSGR